MAETSDRNAILALGDLRGLLAAFACERATSFGFACLDNARPAAGDRTMNNVPLIDELRAIRQRLAEEQDLDVARYAAMLRKVGEGCPGAYVSEPFLPPVPLEKNRIARDAG